MSDSYAIPREAAAPRMRSPCWLHDSLRSTQLWSPGTGLPQEGRCRGGRASGTCRGLSLAPRRRHRAHDVSDRPGRSTSLTGTYRVDDPRDSFWWDHRLETGGERTIDFTTYGPFVVNENAFAPVAGSEANLAWRAALSPSRITVASLPKLREDVSTLQGHLNQGASRAVSVDTGLVTVLDRTDHLLTVTRSGVLIPSVQLAILAGAALLFLAGLLSEGGAESAIMRSRERVGRRRGPCGDGGSLRRARGTRALSPSRLASVEPCGPAGADRPRARSPRDDDVVCPRGPRRPALRRGPCPSRAAVWHGDVHRCRARAAGTEELRPARRPRPDSRRGRPHRVLAAPPLRRASWWGAPASTRCSSRHLRSTSSPGRFSPTRRSGAARWWSGSESRGDGGALGTRSWRAAPSDTRSAPRRSRSRSASPHSRTWLASQRPGRLHSCRGRGSSRALRVDPRAQLPGAHASLNGVRPRFRPRGARPGSDIRARDPARDRCG
jgi:hypothetical protein